MVVTNREDLPQAHKAEWRVASAPEMIVLVLLMRQGLAGRSLGEPSGGYEFRPVLRTF